MADTKPADADNGASRSAANEITSPAAPPGLIFTPIQASIYDYICHALRAAGIEHLTAGLPITVVVITVCQWLDALDKCEREGRTQTAQSGWASPTPWADDEKRLKMELGQWFSKIGLTVTSAYRIKKDAGIQSGQDDLFADLVAHARSFPASGSMN